MKRMVGRASRNRAGRTYALIKQGFLRELRTRLPGMSLRELSRSSELTIVRLGELERGRGKQVTASEATVIARVLYGRAPLEPEGICRVCGCTDEWGCDGGCSWVDAEHTLCSECEGPAS